MLIDDEKTDIGRQYERGATGLAATATSTYRHWPTQYHYRAVNAASKRDRFFLRKYVA